MLQTRNSAISMLEFPHDEQGHDERPTFKERKLQRKQGFACSLVAQPPGQTKTCFVAESHANAPLIFAGTPGDNKFGGSTLVFLSGVEHGVRGRQEKGVAAARKFGSRKARKAESRRAPGAGRA